MAKSLEVMGVMGSGPADWLVTLFLRDGTVSTRRVAPGKVTADQAVDVALLSEGVGMEKVVDVNVRRVCEDKKIEAERVEETLEELLRRMRA